MLSRRIDRIEEQIRIEVSEILEREVHDPRIALVSVTGVEMSPDGRHARLRVSSLASGAAERKKLLDGLKSAAPFIRRSLSQRLAHLKRIPELRFAYDDSLERDSRLAALLDQVRKDEPAG